jgi:hypothetical protein
MIFVSLSGVCAPIFRLIAGGCGALLFAVPKMVLDALSQQHSQGRVTRYLWNLSEGIVAEELANFHRGGLVVSVTKSKKSPSLERKIAWSCPLVVEEFYYWDLRMTRNFIPPRTNPWLDGLAMTVINSKMGPSLDRNGSILASIYELI